MVYEASGSEGYFWPYSRDLSSQDVPRRKRRPNSHSLLYALGCKWQASRHHGQQRLGRPRSEEYAYALENDCRRCDRCPVLGWRKEQVVHSQLPNSFTVSQCDAKRLRTYQHAGQRVRSWSLHAAPDRFWRWGQTGNALAAHPWGADWIQSAGWETRRLRESLAIGHHARHARQHNDVDLRLSTAHPYHTLLPCGWIQSSLFNCLDKWHNYQWRITKNNRTTEWISERKTLHWKKYSIHESGFFLR